MEKNLWVQIAESNTALYHNSAFFENKTSNCGSKRASSTFGLIENALSHSKQVGIHFRMVFKQAISSALQSNQCRLK